MKNCGLEEKRGAQRERSFFEVCVVAQLLTSGWRMYTREGKTSVTEG